MKIVIELNEREIVNALVKVAKELDKETVRGLLRGLSTEFLLSLNPVVVKRLAEKFIEVESEINYRIGQKSRQPSLTR